MRLIVAGTRTFNDYDLLKSTLDHLLSNTTGEIIIVSGKARGADSLGERYAKENGYKIKAFPANWKDMGRAAGPARNREMGKYSTHLVVFWDGLSSGTRNMIETGRELGLVVRVITYK